jgi:hypothetical protein
MTQVTNAAEQYQAALLDITRLASAGFSELASMARTLLLAMESPDFYRYPEHLGTVLDAMSSKAVSIGSAVECEAERIEVFNTNAAWERRAAAYAASGKPR